MNQKTRQNPRQRREQLAAARERELLALERRGVQASARVMRGLIASLRRLPRETGPDVRVIVAEKLAPIVDILSDAMLAAHLTSLIQTREAAESHLKNKPLAFAVSSVFGRSISVLEDRARMSAAEISALRREYADVAFTATKGVGAAIEKKVQKALFQVASTGVETRTAIREFSGLIEKAGISPQANIVEAMYRTQMQIARSVAQWKANEDPVIDEILWGYEYMTVGDDRVRPTHEAMDGVRMPKDDPMWRTWFPPTGYNCRCLALEIFEDDPAAMRKAKAPPATINEDGVVVPLQPDPGFRVNFAEIFSG
jgi:SPP1 gp7 family putative phage head morphogenesis protein